MGHSSVQKQRRLPGSLVSGGVVRPLCHTGTADPRPPLLPGACGDCIHEMAEMLNCTHACAHTHAHLPGVSALPPPQVRTHASQARPVSTCEDLAFLCGCCLGLRTPGGSARKPFLCPVSSKHPSSDCSSEVVSTGQGQQGYHVWWGRGRAGSRNGCRVSLALVPPASMDLGLGRSRNLPVLCMLLQLKSPEACFLQSVKCCWFS